LILACQIDIDTIVDLRRAYGDKSEFLALQLRECQLMSSGSSRHWLSKPIRESDLCVSLVTPGKDIFVTTTRFSVVEVPYLPPPNAKGPLAPLTDR
jgi:hypothetical protein